MSETGLVPTPEVCARRGFHGPFANVDKYNAVPGWEGLADCLTCGTTCRTREAEVPGDTAEPPPTAS